MSQLTIVITSYNRGKYLEALLESLQDECLTHKHELILIDNFSIEKRIDDVINKYQHIITKLILRQESSNEEQDYINDEYKAKNLAIHNSTNDIILFLQDDLQYIGYTGLLQRYIDEFYLSDFYCMSSNAIRQSTINSILEEESLGYDIKYKKIFDNHCQTMGFFKKELFQQCGNYYTTFPKDKMFWGAGEDEYDLRIKLTKKYKQLSCVSSVPLFIPVWNDSRGGYSFLRDGKRYGEYTFPQNDVKLYYQKISQDEFEQLNIQNKPISFGNLVKICKPIGWELQIDENGEPLKYAQAKVLIEGPIGEIDD